MLMMEMLVLSDRIRNLAVYRGLTDRVRGGDVLLLCCRFPGQASRLGCSDGCRANA